MAYTIDTAQVATEVEHFSDRTLRSWKACLDEIAVNPYPRFGFYVDRLIPILGFPMRTWTYEMAQETSISGEVVFIFTGDFFPEYAPVYVVNEDDSASGDLLSQSKAVAHRQSLTTASPY